MAKGLLNDKNTHLLISGVALGGYVAFVVPRLSLNDLSVLDNFTVRIALIVIISLVCLVNPIIAIIMAICFIISIQRLNTLRKHNINKLNNSIKIMLSNTKIVPEKPSAKQPIKEFKVIEQESNDRPSDETVEDHEIKGYKKITKETEDKTVKPFNINIGEYLNTDSTLDNKDIYLSTDNTDPRVNNVLNSEIIDDNTPKVSSVIRQNVFTSDSQFNDISSDLVNCKVSDQAIRTQNNQYSAQGFGNNPGVPEGYSL